MFKNSKHPKNRHYVAKYLTIESFCLINARQ